MLQAEPDVLAEVYKLLEQKRNTQELGLAPAVPLLNSFIESEFEVDVVDAPKKSRSPEVVGRLNELFHEVLQEFRKLHPLE